MPVEMFF